MKKLITLLFAAGLAASTYAANIKLFPLTQYNVLLTTNTTAIGLGSTNVFYTTPQGQAVFSLTNNTVFTTSGSNTATTIVQSNLVAADAFKPAHLYADANGDYNSTATLIIYTGNTNWQPNLYWATNANGLVFLGTNQFGQYWPLASSIFPNWQYPATPNSYPIPPGSATNAVTVNIYCGAGVPNSSGDVPASFPLLWNTSATWSFTENVSAIVPTCVMTNIPASILQNAKDIYITMSAAAVAGQTTPTNVIVNFVGVFQPVP